MDAMIDAGEKYKLNTMILKKRRLELGQIPNWDDRMENNPETVIEAYNKSK
ncbi:hypothetical protein AGMMS49949_08010 [Alphaproteobacteria bacterium]|nr:hypothetical protein AGMMS49949_08010 [Alphaproteobacteria bacterium]GHT00408.1 hypothetical protein AGMMS50296_8710 [Alphaproteobacteria bacterium]